MGFFDLCRAATVDECFQRSGLQVFPNRYAALFLWSADHESGDLQQWHPQGVNYPGGGVLNTGGKDVTASATRQIAHSGEFAAEATIRNRDAFPSWETCSTFHALDR